MQLGSVGSSTAQVGVRKVMEAKSKAQVGPTCVSSFGDAIPCLDRVGVRVQVGVQVRVK